MFSNSGLWTTPAPYSWGPIVAWVPSICEENRLLPDEGVYPVKPGEHLAGNLEANQRPLRAGEEFLPVRVELEGWLPRREGHGKEDGDFFATHGSDGISTGYPTQPLGSAFRRRQNPR